MRLCPWRRVLPGDLTSVGDASAVRARRVGRDRCRPGDDVGTVPIEALAGRSSTRYVRGLAALLAVAVLTSGCAYVDAIGRDPSAPVAAPPGASADAARTVRDAGAATVAAGGATVAVVGTGPARDRVVRTAGSGELDLSGAGARMVLQVTPLGPVRAVLLGRTAYAALPPHAVGDIARGKGWVGVELDAVDPGLYADTIVQLGTGATGNPADVPALLAAVRDDDAARVGPDTIDGVATTHYSATVDLDRVTGPLRAATGRFREDLSTSTLPVEVWVDPTGRLRRVTQVLAQATAEPGSGATSTVTFSDLGPRPRAVAPDAVRVANLPDLLAE